MYVSIITTKSKNINNYFFFLYSSYCIEIVSVFFKFLNTLNFIIIYLYLLEHEEYIIFFYRNTLFLNVYYIFSFKLKSGHSKNYQKLFLLSICNT